MSKTGIVIQSTGKWYKVSSNGEVIDCRIPGKFRLRKSVDTNPVAVGDYVDFTLGDDNKGMIEEIHPRKNFIPRKATRSDKEEQILVANIDRAWVVQSIKMPALKRGFIDRFLVACEAYEISAGVIINKTDLLDKRQTGELDTVTDTYRSLDYPVLHTSIYKPDTIGELKHELSGKTSVLIGHSGVGKTSLINELNPNMNLVIGDVSSYSEKGKHTTTSARLIPVESNSFIVDTPGIKEFGLVNIEPYELSLYFPEMREPRQYCRFNNCTHSHEPKCGVIAAFERGEIDPERYQSYLNMLDGLEA
ncbi:MAG: ribosome small subunit-dependent GTPase A [Balneolaceae bacterium]